MEKPGCHKPPAFGDGKKHRTKPQFGDGSLVNKTSNHIQNQNRTRKHDIWFDVANLDPYDIYIYRTIYIYNHIYIDRDPYNSEYVNILGLSNLVEIPRGTALDSEYIWDSLGWEAKILCRR